MRRSSPGILSPSCGSNESVRQRRDLQRRLLAEALHALARSCCCDARHFARLAAISWDADSGSHCAWITSRPECLPRSCIVSTRHFPRRQFRRLWLTRPNASVERPTGFAFRRSLVESLRRSCGESASPVSARRRYPERGVRDQFRAMATAQLIESLRPGQPGSLKARADGTVLEGHHRLVVLRERGVDIDALPRELVPQEPER